MINYIYGKIKKDHSETFAILMMIFGLCISSLIPAAIACSIDKSGYPISIYCYLAYIAGIVITFICSAQIDFTQHLDYLDKESSIRGWIMIFSLIWPAYLVTGTIFGIIYMTSKIFIILNLFHKNLLGFHKKIKIPALPKIFKKHINSKPIPNNGAYRSSPEICKSCGK